MVAAKLLQSREAQGWIKLVLLILVLVLLIFIFASGVKIFDLITPEKVPK